MRRFGLLVASGLLVLTIAAGAEPAEIAVEVTNASEPVSCAEKDNVTLNLASPTVRRFRIEASHPAYIGMLREDRRAPDWTDCDISPETSAAPEPRRVTFDDGGEVFLLGFASRTFWRPSDVVVRVGDRVERGLEIVQLHLRRAGRSEEVLVVYPADGYWRIKPLSPPHLPGTAYGSSFLIGPVEVDGRPVVNLRRSPSIRAHAPSPSPSRAAGARRCGSRRPTGSACGSTCPSTAPCRARPLPPCAPCTSRRATRTWPGSRCGTRTAGLGARTGS
jgi:hypothetical protein